MNLSGIIAVIGLAGIIIAGALGWFYRGHVDAGQTAAAIAQITLKADQKVATANAAACWSMFACSAAELQSKLDQQRQTYESQIASVHADLVRAGSCAIPVLDIGLLVKPANGASGGKLPAAAGPPSPNPQPGAVAASDIIETCESNRGRFERNLDRLASCVKAYDGARSALNGLRAAPAAR